MRKFDNDYKFTLVETEGQLNRFSTESAHVGWVAFDTEFIPEKYYKYKLCVISASTPRGNFIIDTLKLKHIVPFIKLIENPAIVKITHAGENDYQMLVNDHDARPRNVFDTQLSNGFLQFDYPVGLQPLIYKALRIKVDKGALLSDWEKRPLTGEQCQYAVKDVVYLHPLMVSLQRRLKRAGKLEWAMEENQRLENRDYYKTDPLDFLNTAQVNQLNKKQKVFLMRMHMWRHLEAEKENRPLTQILKTGVLNAIVQKIPSGETTLLKDRTLPTRFLRENLETFRHLYEKKISPHEKELLDQATETASVSSRNGILMDMLHQLVKYRGIQQGVSSKLILPGKELQKMKSNMKYMPPDLKQGWRKQVLGKDLIKLLENRKDFNISIKKNKFTLSMGRKPGAFFKNLLKGKERDED